MKKLKELINLNNTEKITNSSDILSTADYKLGEPSKHILQSNDYDNYKGIRFYTKKISDYEQLISIVLPEKSRVIGNIKIVNTFNLFKIFDLFNINSSYQITKLQLYNKFNEIKFIFIIYEYIIKKYGKIISDNLSHNVLHDLWTNILPKYLNGPVFAIHTENKFPSIQLVENIQNNSIINKFIAFSNKNKVNEKIYTVCNYIKKNTNNYFEIKWIVSKKGKTETLKQIKNENYIDLFNYNLSKDIFKYSERFIILGQNYCILVHKNNSKIKVIDF